MLCTTRRGRKGLRNSTDRRVNPCTISNIRDLAFCISSCNFSLPIFFIPTRVSVQPTCGCGCGCGCASVLSPKEILYKRAHIVTIRLSTQEEKERRKDDSQDEDEAAARDRCDHGKAINLLDLGHYCIPLYITSSTILLRAMDHPSSVCYFYSTQKRAFFGM